MAKVLVVGNDEKTKMIIDILNEAMTKEDIPTIVFDSVVDENKLIEKIRIPIDSIEFDQPRNRHERRKQNKENKRK
jgi:hypothetical protein